MKDNNELPCIDSNHIKKMFDVIERADHSKTKVYLVTNVVGRTTVNDYSLAKDSILIEYFTESEFDQILNGIKSNGYHVDIFFNEKDFIEFVICGDIDRENGIVFNLARNGKGLCKKSLIPSFCDTYDINFTGPDSYLACLGRHKYHYNRIINFHRFPAVESWLYSDGEWLNETAPEEGIMVIVKPAFESASRGIHENSVFEYTRSRDRQIALLGKEFEQDVIVQRFIEGYEVQVPLVEVDGVMIPVMVVGISIDNEHKIGNKIITYDTAFDGKYDFFDYSVLNIDISKEIMNVSKGVSKVLGLKNYARIDFRISENDEFFITDISTHPFLIKHSAFTFSFEQKGIGYEKMFAYIIDSLQ